MGPSRRRPGKRGANASNGRAEFCQGYDAGCQAECVPHARARGEDAVRAAQLPDREVPHELLGLRTEPLTVEQRPPERSSAPPGGHSLSRGFTRGSSPLASTVTRLRNAPEEAVCPAQSSIARTARRNLC